MQLATCRWTTPSTPLFAISASWIPTVSTGFARIISPFFSQCWQRIILRGISEQAYSKAAYKMGLGLNFACEPEVPTVDFLGFCWDYQTIILWFIMIQVLVFSNSEEEVVNWLYPTPSHPFFLRVLFSFKHHFSWYFLAWTHGRKKAGGFFVMAGYGGDSWSTPFAGHSIGVLEVLVQKRVFLRERLTELETW